jgi:hypothetical protein
MPKRRRPAAVSQHSACTGTLGVDVGLRHLSICTVLVCPESQRLKLAQWAVLDVFSCASPTNRCQTLVKSTGCPCGRPADCRYDSDSQACYKHVPAHLRKSGDYHRDPPRPKVRDHSLQSTAVAVLSALDDFIASHAEALSAVSSVVIELQPRVNNRMKFVSHLILGRFSQHFVARPVVVKFVGASTKLKGWPQSVMDAVMESVGTQASPYVRRKRMSVGLVEALLADGRTFEAPDSWAQWLQQQGQKHDAADALLYCVQECQRRPQARNPT